MENEIKLFYDLTADKTADEWYKEQILRPTIKDFLSLLQKKNPRIMDLGCGPGHESMRLSEEGAEVVGIDFSEKCIAIAKKRCPQCIFEVLDFRFIDDRFGRFEGVFACGSLIHIKPSEMTSILDRIRKILNKAGYIAILIVDGEGISEKMSVLKVEGKKLNRTVYLYRKDYLIQLANQAGFTFVRQGYLDSKLIEYGWRNYIFQKV